MKLLKSNKGFSKTGILIAVGVFVLIVAISIPVAFGFIKGDHPDVNIPTSTPTEDNTPNSEIELGIIDKILPSGMDFEENSEAKQEGSETDGSDNPTKPSDKTPSYKPTKPITGEANTNIKVETNVEEEGTTFVPETKPSDKYEDVDVSDDDVVVIPPVVTKPTQPEETTPPTTQPTTPKEEDNEVGVELEEVEDGEMPDFLP